ncbi:hypothetical protein [Lysinibacillus sphaericus]|uniref:hypothetical protein n=1 Tax=Lysinibacillus sphaericus TaxID=1421 RepID=UPI00039BF7F8|nr:hypothetical protein [Lysinibacillus sphaericus]
MIEVSLTLCLVNFLNERGRLVEEEIKNLCLQRNIFDAKFKGKSIDGFLNNFKIFERNEASLRLMEEGGEKDGI